MAAKVSACPSRNKSPGTSALLSSSQYLASSDDTEILRIQMTASYNPSYDHTSRDSPRSWTASFRPAAARQLHLAVAVLPPLTAPALGPWNRCIGQQPPCTIAERTSGFGYVSLSAPHSTSVPASLRPVMSVCCVLDSKQCGAITLLWTGIARGPLSPPPPQPEY